MTTPSQRRPLTSRDTAWARALSGWLVQRRVTPNAISVAGMGFATLGAAAYLATAWAPARWVGALLLLLAVAGLQLRLLCNLLDGMVAVEGGLKGKAGDLFNEAPDRYADIVLLAAAGWAAGVPVAGWIAATAAVLTAYVRALGASLGQGQDYSGPGAKQHRMFLLTVGTLAAIVHGPALRWTLWLLIAITLLTACRRTWRLWQRLP